MKKSFLLSILLYFSTVLSACGCKKTDKVEKFMARGIYNAISYVEIDTAAELQAKIDNEESFVLYLYSSICNNCKEFKSDVLEPFIAETHMEIFAIETSVAGLSKVIKVNSTPTLVVYNEGLIESKVDPTKSDAFNSVSELKTYLSKYVYLPQFYYVTKAQMDSLLSSSESFFLFFESYTCGDCYKFKNESLYPYLKDNTLVKKFYVYEVSDYRGSEEEGVWQQFKDDYGLSNTKNQLGYGVGYVPSIQYIESGVIKDMMVFYNDTEKVQHEDGTFSYSVSYYPDESPALTQKYTSYTDYQEKAFSFYNRKFVEFVNNHNK